MTANQPDDDFRRRLFDAQEITPPLRDAYRKGLDDLVYETHTARTRTPAIILLAICLGVVIAEVRALFVHPGNPAFYTGAVTMLLACTAAAAWILRDLARGRSVRLRSLKIADLFYGAAGILTVASLMHGISKPSDPASTFNAFYVFVFLFVCASWSIYNRVAAAELTLREHTLRLEARLADLAERLEK